MAGNPVQANTLVIDFYTVLNAELQARGMEYTAFTVNNADIEMPMIDTGSPTYLSDVRLVDHDVILVREDHNAVSVLNSNYQAQLELDLGGTSVAFTRGYLAVDVNVKETTYRFVNTHLEVRSAPGSVFRYFQSLQMQELVGTLAYLSNLDPKPIVMVGDFNSSIEDEEGCWEHPAYGCLPYVPPYMQAVAAGYLDSWVLQRTYGDGFTSGFDEYVSDPTAELTSRIDIVFTDPKGLEIDKITADVVGDEVGDMTPSGFWPSDHAGVVTKIKFNE
jgi:endonuclease/exonuclease/phosphatase family metal-dependent hydrolase